VKLGRDDTAGPAALTAQLAGASGVFWMKDPAVGDRIAVVTALAPAKGLAARRTLIDAVLPPSVQGLAVEPLADDLTVSTDGDVVRIGRPGGLALSPAPVLARKAPAAGLPQPAALPALVDFAGWSQLGEGGFLARYDQLITAASEEAAKGKAAGVQARLSLARFLVGSELAYEAIGALNMAARADGTLMGDPEFRGLRGAARAMAGRYADAQADFSSPALANDPSSALWRGYVAMKLGDATGARQAFAAGRSALPRFAPKWLARFARADAEAAIASGDLNAARSSLALADAQKLDPIEAQATALDRARLLDAAGQPQQALALYDKAAQSSYGALAAPALQRAIEIRLNTGKISPADALNGLDSLRFRWRGDNTELETVRTLGRIYLSQGRYREALDALRSAGRRMTDLPAAAAQQTDLYSAFRSLFLGGAADGLEPVQSLALFYDFKELTPVGAEGDMMVRRLVRRLVDVDLLDQAAELLKYQAENRLDGVPRAEVATDLAMIQLMNRQPELALQAINSSRTTLLPPALTAERRLVEARANLGLGRYDNALEVLGQDKSPEARDLRGEIAWKQQDWAGAGGALEAGLGDRWKSAIPLSADEESRLIRAGTAYSLAGDNASLTRLRSRFARLAQGARQPEAMQVALTGDVAPGLSAAALARSVSDADALAGWVDRMKKRFRDRPASTASAAPARGGAGQG
jgi:tetratricopeptide (TPR) repeat protein